MPCHNGSQGALVPCCGLPDDPAVLCSDVAVEKKEKEEAVADPASEDVVATADASPLEPAGPVEEPVKEVVKEEEPIKVGRTRV
jgi:hypothetical protein